MRLAGDDRRLRKLAKTIAQVRGPYRSRLDETVDIMTRLRVGDNLATVNTRLLEAVIRALGRSDLVFVIAPDRQTAGTKSERLRALLDKHAPGMSEYYTGVGARDYLNPKAFAGPVRWQRLSGFDPEVSTLQLLARPDPVDRIMTMGGAWE